MTDLPISSTFNRASLLDRPTGTGIVVVQEQGRVFFCLLEKLDKPKGWTSMPSIPTEKIDKYVPKVVGLVEGHLMVFGHGETKLSSAKAKASKAKGVLVSFQWDESNLTWMPAPVFKLNSNSRDLNSKYAPYTSAPLEVLPNACYRSEGTRAHNSNK